MRFTAQHSDGFTERLLRYTVSYCEGVAELEASWFRPEPRTKCYRATFPLDIEPLVRSLPALRLMAPDYEATWEDLDLKVLDIESPQEALRVRVYGGGVLQAAHPELQPWFEVWRWLEEQVVLHLPH